MKRHSFGILALAALVVAGCGGNGGGASSSVKSAVKSAVHGKIVWPAALTRVVPFNTKSIRLTLSTPGLADRTRLVLPPTDGATTSPYAFEDVPVGNGYTLTAQAFPTTDGTGTPLATASTDFDLPATGRNDVNVTMASTVDRLGVALGGQTYLLGPDGVLKDSNGATVAALDLAGPSNLSIDTRDKDGNLVLVDGGATGTSTVDATSANATVSRIAGTSTATFRVTPTTGGPTTVVVTYTYQTGASTTFTIPVQAVVTGNLVYGGTFFPSGNLIRGGTYTPTLTLAGSPVDPNDLVFTAERTNPGDPDPATLVEIGANGSIRVVAPDSTDLAHVTLVATYKNGGPVAGKADLTVGAVETALSAVNVPAQGAPSVRYTATEQGGANVVTGLLPSPSGGETSGTIVLPNHGFDYAVKAELFSNADGTGIVLARATTSAPYAFGTLPGDPASTLDLTAGNLVSAVGGATVGGQNLQGYAFTGSNTYRIDPVLTVDGAAQTVPIRLLNVTIAGSGASLFGAPAADGSFTIGSTSTTKTATITLEYRLFGESAASAARTATFNVTVKPSTGGAGGTIG